MKFLKLYSKVCKGKDENMVTKEKKYRKFEANVIGTPPLSMVLVDIPEPDPGKKEFGRNKVNNRKKHLFQDSDLVTRLIEYLAKK